jgi:hypothetical protein
VSFFRRLQLKVTVTNKYKKHKLKMANGKRKQKRKKNEFVHQCTQKAQAIMAERMKKIE